MGGPSVFPELPVGIENRGGWKVTTDENERNRRSVYIFVRRNTRYPMFETFDMPDTHESCARRNVTTSPLQALSMLNDKLTLEWAEHFAGRVKKIAGADQTKQIRVAFELALARTPTPDEEKTVSDFFRERADSNEPNTSPLVDFCHVLFNSNEFVYEN
jgi:hypothetical protein